ncbi:GTPase HflX N-terminal domain-containing protein [Paenibacillus phoenicis]
MSKVHLHETTTHQTDVAVLVSLVTSETKQSGINSDYSLAELVQLAETGGVEVAVTVVQYREKPDPRWLIGKGKVLELRDRHTGAGGKPAGNGSPPYPPADRRVETSAGGGHEAPATASCVSEGQRGSANRPDKKPLRISRQTME